MIRQKDGAVAAGCKQLSGACRGPHSSTQQAPHLNLSLHILDGVAGLHLEGDGLAREGLRRRGKVR